MNPKASFGNIFRSKLRCIIPSALRDCSTYQFRYIADALSELEFHNKIKYISPIFSNLISKITVA
jgi:hypothetical protein